MGFMRGGPFGTLGLGSAAKAMGDARPSRGVVGARLFVDGVGDEGGMRVGSPLGFKGLKPVSFGS